MKIKYPLTVCLSVLVAVLALVCLGHSSLRDARSGYETVRRKAEGMGLAFSPEGSLAAGNRSKVSERRPLAERQRDAESLVKELGSMFALLDEADAGSSPAMDKLSSLLGRIQQLDAEQIACLDEMAKKACLEDTPDGQNLAQTYMLLLLELSDQKPELALDHLNGCLHTDGMDYLSRHCLAKAFTDWSSRDPDMAARWFRKASEGWDDSFRSGFAEMLTEGAAKHDPLAAQRILEELGMEGNPDLFLTMIKSAAAAGHRDTVLEILRNEHPGDGSDVGQKKLLGFLALGDHQTHRGFEVESRWIDQAGLSDEEMSDVLWSLGSVSTTEEKGKWLEWLLKKGLPEENKEAAITSLLQGWVQQDYQMANQWLVAQPQGDDWNHAAGVFADTIFQTFPDDAVIWLESIPKGEQRQEIARSFLAKWPRDSQKDRAAADAFAEREGIR